MGNFPLSNTIQKCNIASKEQPYLILLFALFLRFGTYMPF